MRLSLSTCAAFVHASKSSTRIRVPSYNKQGIPSGKPLVLLNVSIEMLVDGLSDVAVTGTAVSKSMPLYVVPLCATGSNTGFGHPGTAH